ncbi:hypothetical protein ACTMU2_00050 [Cupriavidus basilensis]
MAPGATQYEQRAVRVTDRIYQVRGLDISNMTIIEGDTGLIIIRPAYLEGNRACGAGAVLQSIGRKNSMVAVIYTTTHGDHFGSVKGVTTEEDVKAGRVGVRTAPEGFMEEAVMRTCLPARQWAAGRSVRCQPAALGLAGHVDSGLGKAVSHRSITLRIPPTDLIARTGETRTIDGVQINSRWRPAPRRRPRC